MSLCPAFSSRTSAWLVAANLLAWTGWFAARTPYSDLDCARLNAQREAQDLEVARGEPGGGNYASGDHLLFGRPIRSGEAEPLHFKALYLANFLPLKGAWSFVVPWGSRALGPTCAESRVCGVLFIILSSVQWLLVGAVISSLLGRVASTRTWSP